MNISEIKNVVNYLIDNNKQLANEGKKPVAIGLEGDAGIGKTSIIEEIAKERGATFIKIILSQLEETGDLCGFPIKQYLVKETKLNDNGESEIIESWVPESVLSSYFNRPCEEYEITNTTRMAYAPPAWLPTTENPNGTILCLDDFSRANITLLQSIMELIDRGTYMTWSLPKGTTVLLTSNPDNGEYTVTSVDSAMTSRMVKFNVNFDIYDWATWAEFKNIDGRAINFALNYATELFENRDAKLSGINARSYVNFCNCIQGINNWEDRKSLALILSIAKGCFNDETGFVGGLFTAFIDLKLDKLISPDDMLSGEWSKTSKEIEKLVYKNDEYDASIASILMTRLHNRIIKYFTTKGSKENVVINRILEIIDYNKTKRLFSEDLLFNLCKTLIAKYPARTKKLLLNQDIKNVLL